MTKIVAVSMEDICRDVVKAATQALKAHGIEKPGVVVNVVWSDSPDPQLYAIGTAIPKLSRPRRRLLGDSLSQSAEEAFDAR